jgi:A/G-specific adenine glycosylase
MRSFTRKILGWFPEHGRRQLPWQNSNAYQRWLSEIMLQQTQVATVIPYFQRFVTRFPDVATLANAEQDEVLHMWSGLGYYARARNLHRCAQLVCEKYHGVFPNDFDTVCALPGIGRSTAGAILAFAYGQRQAILDANVKRVLCRYHAIRGWPGQGDIEKLLWQLAEDYTPAQSVSKYTQAIMDIGATVCRQRNPQCRHCPLQTACLAHSQGNAETYPDRKAKKRRPTRATTMLLIQNPERHILLQKRPPSGIWGGLWSLPECSTGDIDGWCRQHLGLRVKPGQPWPTLRHSFSHYHLDITPVPVQLLGACSQVMETSPTVWYNLRHPDARGLATPVLSLLDKMRQAT